MQSNFDPKLYQSIDEAKKAHKSLSERGVERGRPVEEQDEQRKKFDLDEQLGGKDKEGKKVGEGLTSALGLASTTRKREGRGWGGGSPHDLVAEQAKDGAKLKESPTTNQPFHIAMMQTQTEAQLEQTALPQNAAKSVKEMIKLLVASIVEMKQEGKTDTTLTLQHPPLFAGAKLTLTTYDTAKGEFNITFSELTPAAKQMIDQQIARESLMRTLEEKGFVVHILITTTEKENTPLTMGESRQPKEEREKKERDGRQREEDEE